MPLLERDHEPRDVDSTEAGVMPLLERDHEPRDVDSLFKLEKGKEWILP